MSEKQVVLSGIRPTAEDQHLGNYLGAIRYFVELSHRPELDCFFFIADQHALTTSGTVFDAEGIRRGRRAIMLNLLAAGVNPNATIFAQSAVPETSELNWILACLARVHELEGMHHWMEKKDKLVTLGAEANAGLLTYPVLMAADILGPRASIVPVGKDQHQHVEFARDLARTFNRVTGTSFFPVPDLHEHPEVTIKSLAKPAEKMGKSEMDGCVFLNDSDAEVHRKMARAISDPQRQRRTDPGNPYICNVYSLHQELSDGPTIQWALTGCQDASIGCIECKGRVAEGILQITRPIRERRQELEAQNPSKIDELLAEGNARARARIAPTVAEAKELMGLAEAAIVSSP